MNPLDALRLIIAATAAETDARSMRICDVARASLAASQISTPPRK